MNVIYLALCGLFLFGANASPFPNDECARGPVLWCKNLMEAKKCNAVTHCIQTVWEPTKWTGPEDNDSVCKICTDMVTQARDQLRSNETQADLKAVFEGTCRLLVVKPIRKECDKIVDQFVPELVEALSSEMNPQVVCSVAGLCNNVEIDRMIEIAERLGHSIVSPKATVATSDKKLSCAQCNKVSNIIADKFASSDRDAVLENMLLTCGKLSSFSDSCAAIVLSYFNEIYSNMKTTLTAENLCHMSGTCADQFHQHEESSGIEITPDSQIGFVQPESDDIPCDLCKQLVTHLRDVLVANTTQTEFKQVLEGICKQTKSFKKECLSIADQYYDIIYTRLTTDLDPSGACFMIGVCPKGFTETQNQPIIIRPLIPAELAEQRKVLGRDEPVFTNEEIKSFQLPKDVLLLDVGQLEQQSLKSSGELCTLCEYFLHFAQEALSSPKNEEDIKKVFDSLCDKVPSSYRGQCLSFVSTYADAAIALFVQDIDPSQICPKLNVCARSTPTANEKCPLCLFLVQDLEEVIKSNRTEENIRHELDSLCGFLPPKLKAECVDFVHTYTNELVEKLAQDFSPQEICLNLRLCTPKEEVYIEHLGDKKTMMNDFISNTIYQIGSDDIGASKKDNDDELIEFESVDSDSESSPECILCQHLVKEVEKKAVNDKSKEHIKQVLDEACSSFHKKELKEKCIELVNKNADYIINAIISGVTPKEICIGLGFCLATVEIEIIKRPSVVNDISSIPPALEDKYKDKPECVLCELIMTRLEAELKNKHTQDEIRHSVENICTKLPRSVAPNCKSFIDQYEELIISMLISVPPKELCGSLNLCLQNQFKDTSMNEVTECGVCHAAVEALTIYLKKHEKDDRELVVDDICHMLPAKYHKRCIDFMEIYIESLENLIEREEKDICVKVGMCYKSGDNSLFVEIKDELQPEIKVQEKLKRLFGVSECTFGPSYWCSSPEAMEKCHAQAFCTQRGKSVKVISP